MGHDQLFKAVLQGHFREFLELFFHSVAEQLDFDTLKFLDKELFVNVPDGRIREPDLVAEIRTYGGEKELVLVHIEIQARPARDFARRMFEYYALLRLQRRRPVFPVVLYLRGGNGLSDEEYLESFLGRELLRFRYASVGLAQLEPQEYLRVSALGAALAALMSRAETGDPLALRVAMLRQISESSLDDARKFLLGHIVENYFELTDEEASRYQGLLAQEGYQEVKEMEATWADKMMEKGSLAAQRRTLLRQMEAKFGPPSEETRRRVEALDSSDVLDTYLERILTANSVEKMEPAEQVLEVTEMEATWADKMIEKGRIAEQRRTLLRLMEAKFGAISDGVRLGVDKLQSDVLDTYLERILTANSIEEMGID